MFFFEMNTQLGSMDEGEEYNHMEAGIWEVKLLWE